MGNSFIIIKKYKIITEENFNEIFDIHFKRVFFSNRVIEKTKQQLMGKVYLEEYDIRNHCYDNNRRIFQLLKNQFNVDVWEYIDFCQDLLNFSVEKFEKQKDLQKILEKIIPKINEQKYSYVVWWLGIWLENLQKGYNIGYSN